MSGSELRRWIAPLVLLSLPLLGCGAEPEQGTTLPTSGQSAKAQTPVDGLDEPVSLEALAAHVQARARALAAAEYVPPEPSGARSLAGVDYETYRRVRFRPDAAYWQGEARFEVQLMHPGALYRRPVRIHLVENGVAGPALAFDSGLFQYEGPAEDLAAALPDDVGYSGFRVHFPLNAPDVMDEVVVFQGASYFRLIGPGHVYGLSARGLGIDIGGEEEFPDFTDFWLVRPEPDDVVLVFHALLDSPSLTGAFAFELEPGSGTVLSVDARLFARTDVEWLGVAPLSSMYLYGPNRDREFDDFRPEVHDSDGLLVLTSRSEWIWRPLSNRRSTLITSLLDEEPQGFGLAQRARDFDGYLDLEARYDRRPSVWVRVLEGDWGRGAVRLAELPTDSEFSDNVAAAWVPDGVFGAGEERRFRYELVTFDARLEAQTLLQVVRTRVGRDALPGAADPRPPSHRRFVVDFTGDVEGETVEPIIESTSGLIADLRAERLPSGSGWRVSWRLEPDGDTPSDMRLFLRSSQGPVSETWSYVWRPEELDG